jgi:hypothetical protein
MNRITSFQEKKSVTDVSVGFIHMAGSVDEAGFEQKQRSKS